MKVKTMATGGFTLVEITITVAIIGLLAGIATPRFIRVRESSQLAAIINNLRQIDSAKEVWALENRVGSGVVAVDTNIAPYMKINAMPHLVVGETYNINPVGEFATATTPVRLGTIPPGGTVMYQ